MRYNKFNDILLKLREEFHKNGRFDDSNTKLDEIVKLLAISFIDAKNNYNKFNLEYLEKIAEENTGNKENIAIALRTLFEEMAKDTSFYNTDGTNIFGSNPTLNIQESENKFAIELITGIGELNFKQLIEDDDNIEFDIINECFGHFVRENFRNNKEDAQYMTPQEIVEPLLKMVLSDLIEDGLLEQLIEDDDFVIMDPTCGVGTLVIELLRNIIRYVQSTEIDINYKDKLIRNLKNNSMVGQDKVDRMVRLAKINAMFMGCNFSNIYHGNSIVGETSLDKYFEKVDIIISNPPFGAMYNIEEIKDEKGYSIITELNDVTNINSELLILDRCLSWLKPGGKLIIVLPDSVVSSKGIYSKYREKLLEIYDIKSVIELPAETFAQAGTRTKTSILYLQKKLTKNNNIFMAVCNDIGFDVKERKGVPVKQQKGTNEMYEIADSYIKNKASLSDRISILNNIPSCTTIPKSAIIDNFLTPSFYSSDRLQVLYTLSNTDKEIFDIVTLGELANFESKNKKRKKLLTSKEIKHISLLHIKPDHTIDFNEVEGFEPVSKGTECYEGDVLFSKLNPRIPRIAVVPKYDKNLVCSNEFEILTPKNGISPYILNIILSLDLVKKQIEALTSGTSSSHNRIKSEQLMDIKIPFPRKNTKEYSELIDIAKNIEKCIEAKYNAEKMLKSQKQNIETILGI